MFPDFFLTGFKLTSSVKHFETETSEFNRVHTFKTLSRSFKESAWKKQCMQASVQRFAQGNISHWYYGRMHDTMLDWNRIWAVTNHWFCLWLAYFFAQKLLSRCTLYLLRSKTPEDSRRWTLESLEDSTLEQKLLGSLGHRRWRLGPLAMLGGRRKRRKRIWFSCCSLVPVSDTSRHFEKSQMSQLCLKLCVNCVNCSLTRCQKSSHTCFSTAVSWNHGRHFVTLGFDRSQLVGITMLDAALAKSKHQKCIKCRWHFQSRHYVCTSIIFYNHLYNIHRITSIHTPPAKDEQTLQDASCWCSPSQLWHKGGSGQLVMM
jgi:hypothetical protein